MKRRLLALVLCALMLTACNPQTPPETPDAGGVLNVCAGGEPNPLNPASKSDKAFFDLLYDPLFAPNNRFEPQPVLAERYEISGNQVTITLRPSLCFSDGTEIDAADVVQTVRTLQQHPEYVYAPAVADVADITATADRTVTITLTQTDAFFVEGLTFPILPAEAQTGLYAAGSGPYRFASASQTEHFFEINEYYRDQAPYISSVRMHILPDAETVRYAYRSGTVDLLYTQARMISDYSGVGSTATPFESMKLSCVGYRADHPLLGNKTVRQAISMAVDRDKLIRDVLMGYGTATALPFQPNHYRFADRFEAPVLDPDTAAEKVTQVLASSEEPLDPGFSLLVNSDDAASVNLGVSISAMLASCGLTVTVEKVPFDVYTQRIAEGAFDAYLGQVDFFSADDAKTLMTTGGAINYGGYANESLDRLFAALGTAQTDAAFDDALQAAATFLKDEQPILSLYFEQDLLMSKDSVLGDKTPAPEQPFSGVCGWYR